VERFGRDGFCPCSKPNLVREWVRGVEVTKKGFVLTVEIIEPRPKLGIWRG
jgi:hypothetical protein